MYKSFLLSMLSLFTVAISSYAQEQQNTPSVYRLVAVEYANPSVESVSNEIEVYLPMKIYFPSAFTPNGDGLNDTFGAVGEGIESYQLTVYNRWGEILFTSRTVSQKWDGTYNGKAVPMGKYNYELIAYGNEFGEIYTSGSVMVIN